jgi:hypothetical protein
LSALRLLEAREGGGDPNRAALLRSATRRTRFASARRLPTRLAAHRRRELERVDRARAVDVYRGEEVRDALAQRIAELEPPLRVDERVVLDLAEQPSERRLPCRAVGPCGLSGVAGEASRRCRIEDDRDVTRDETPAARRAMEPT